MAAVLYNRGKTLLADGRALTGVLKALLVVPGFTPDPTHDTVDQVAGDELPDGTGYVGGYGGAGRATCAGRAILEDDDNGRAAFDLDDLSWPGLDAGAAAGAVLFIEGASDAASDLLGFFDIASGDVTTNGSTLTLAVPATGLVWLT